MKTILFALALFFFMWAVWTQLVHVYNKARLALKYEILDKIRRGEEVKSAFLEEFEEAGLIKKDGDKYVALFGWNGERLTK